MQRRHVSECMSDCRDPVSAFRSLLRAAKSSLVAIFSRMSRRSWRIRLSGSELIIVSKVAICDTT